MSFVSICDRLLHETHLLELYQMRYNLSTTVTNDQRIFDHVSRYDATHLIVGTASHLYQ